MAEYYLEEERIEEVLELEDIALENFIKFFGENSPEAIETINMVFGICGEFIFEDENFCNKYIEKY